jgi:hypothetical protein
MSSDIEKTFEGLMREVVNPEGDTAHSYSARTRLATLKEGIELLHQQIAAKQHRRSEQARR